MDVVLKFSKCTRHLKHQFALAGAGVDTPILEIAEAGIPKDRLMDLAGCIWSQLFSY